jgi:hypothetical protein
MDCHATDSFPSFSDSLPTNVASDGEDIATEPANANVEVTLEGADNVEVASTKVFT